MTVGVTVSTLKKVSEWLTSSKGDKTTSPVGGMMLGPNSIHAELKAGPGHGGAGHPRSCMITGPSHHALPQVQGPSLAHPSTFQPHTQLGSM